MPKLSSVTARQAEPEDLAALLTLFEAAGGGCYCQWWHFDGDDYAWQQRCAQDSNSNRQAFEDGAPQLLSRQSTARDEWGVVALEANGSLVGWLKLCRPLSAPKIYARRLYRTLGCFAADREQTWVIACTLTHPEYRRRGIARALLTAAIDIARATGARHLEALARAPQEPTEDALLAMGPATLLAELGFSHVAGPDNYPVMRVSF